MTQDEIIEMAKLAGFEMDDSGVLSPQVLWYIYQVQLEAFAKLIEAKATEREREACAKIVEESYLPDAYSEECLPEIADEIRARGEK